MADLRAYIDLLPPHSRDFILKYRVNGIQTMQGLLNAHDVCRHTVGDHLMQAAHGLAVYITNDDEPAFFNALHERQIYQPQVINGLRIRFRQ